MGTGTEVNRRGAVRRLLRRRAATLSASAVAVLAVLAVFVVHHEDGLAQGNELAAERAADEFEGLYAENAAQILASGTHTNAELEPPVVAHWRNEFFELGGRGSIFMAYPGAAKLLGRDGGPSIGQTGLSIQVDIPYTGPFGTAGTFETCYAISIDTTSHPTPPVTSIHPCTPENLPIDAAATS